MLTSISRVSHRFCTSTRSIGRQCEKRWHVCTVMVVQGEKRWHVYTVMVVLYIYSKILGVRLPVYPVKKKTFDAYQRLSGNIYPWLIANVMSRWSVILAILFQSKLPRGSLPVLCAHDISFWAQSFKINDMAS